MAAFINGTRAPTRPLHPGIYAPVPTFFLPESEDLDIPTFQKHIISMAQKGMGILVGGSMGEAHHCTPAERAQLVRSAREALDQAGFRERPIIAGAGVGSTRGTIELCREVSEAGADVAIVIASGYYAGAIRDDRKALKKFWVDVAEASPIPVMIYNYPGACGGINLDSQLIEDIALSAPNTAGVKLTCGDVGKLTRICSVTSVPSFAQSHPRKNEAVPFLVLGGLADFIVPSTFARGQGAIVGLGNVAPRVLVRCFELAVEALSNSSPVALEAAQHLQDLAARGDFVIAQYGVSGTKDLLQRMYGYGGVPRRPLVPLDKEQSEALWGDEDVKKLIAMEMELEAKAYAVTKQ